MNFAAVNLGCKVNHVELEEFSAAALGHGFRLSTQTDADLILINTCTVTGEAERKTRKAVNRALAANDHATVLLTGCSVAINPDYYEALSPRVLVLGKPQVPTYLEELASTPAYAHEAAQAETGVSGTSPFRTRSGIRVQDGCDNACTYCIVHTARGHAVSLPREGILSQAITLLEGGTREIVLTGINLGSYHDERGGLAPLLEDLLALTDRYAYATRFRLSSIEPADIDDDLIALMAREAGRVCRHVHIPLQSGSSKVLAEMNRHYTAEDFANLVSRLRAAMPEISLSTDIIVGFPGETEADFAQTLALSRACAFSKIHVFPYSMRAGTPAAARIDQIPPQVKQARAKELRALSDELRAADYAARVGTAELVLAEGNGYGMTESYHHIPVPASIAAGELVPLVLPVIECFTEA